jgi:predicted RNA-binding protein YlxR (DUF448 family)
MGCRERKRKEELIRFTQGEERTLIPNLGKKPLPGRGFYLCPTLKCLRMAQKKNPWGRFSGSHGSPISIETVLTRSPGEGGGTAGQRRKGNVED